MPLRTAFKRNPEAVFLAVDAPAYLEASKRVMDVLRSFPAVVEVMGWDEAFMAVSADGPEALARDAQAAVLEQTELGARSASATRRSARSSGADSPNLEACID